MIGSIVFGLFGLGVLISIAWLASMQRKVVDWKLVASGIGLQNIISAGH